jgi:hypothetical protein
LLPQPQVLELLEVSTTDIDNEVTELREKLEGVHAGGDVRPEEGALWAVRAEHQLGDVGWVLELIERSLLPDREMETRIQLVPMPD